jgi:hypothetical protein
LSGFLWRVLITLIGFDEGSRGDPGSRSASFRLSHTTSTALPKPRVVINELDFLAIKELLTNTLCLSIIIPLLEVNKDALELFARRSSLVYHIHSPDTPHTEELFKCIFDHLPGDVGESPRDANARLGLCKKSVVHVGRRHDSFLSVLILNLIAEKSISIF